MTALRLGWLLLARGGRGTLARVAAMAVGIAAAAVAAGMLVAAPGLLAAQAERRADRDLAGDVAGSSLLATSTVDVIDGTEATRVALAGTGDLPPGLARVPAPGEIVWSPALAALAARDPLVAQRFPQRPVGTIGRAGLVEPGELYAYIGVAPTSPALSPSTFGGRPADDGGRRDAVNAVLGLAVFLALPAGAFLATSARLSAQARIERLATLRLVGLRRRTVRLVNAVETTVVAVIGAVAGLAAWTVLQPWLGRRGVGPFRWFGTDARVGTGPAVAIVLGLVVLALVVATVTVNHAIDQPLATRRRDPRPPRLAWRAVTLGAGAALIVAVGTIARPTTGALAALLTGSALALVGVALAVPVVSHALGRVVSRRARGATGVVVAGRLRHQASVAGRVTSGLLVATFALGVAQGVLGAFRDVEAEVPVSGATIARNVHTVLPADTVRTLPGVRTAVERRTLTPETVIPPAPADPGALPGDRPSDEPVGGDTSARHDAVVATCAQMAAILHQALPACPPGRPFELVVDGRAETGATAVPVDFQPGQSWLVTGLVVPPGTPVEPTDGDVVFWLVDLDPAETPRFEAALVGADPLAFAGVWGDEQLGDRVAALVTAGAVAAFVLAIGAVVIASADRAVEAQRLDTNLLAFGLPARVLRAAALAHTVGPVGLAVVLAAALGAMVGWIYRRGGAADLAVTPPFPWTELGWSLGAGLAGVALAGGLAFALTRRQITATHLRAE